MAMLLLGLTFFFLVTQTAGFTNIADCTTKYEVASTVGGTATLPCHFPPSERSKDDLWAVWLKKANGPEDIVVHPCNQHQNQSKAYMGRTTMSLQWSAHREIMALSIENITQSDAGEYSCYINKSSSDPGYKCCTIVLHLEDNKSGDRMQVVVAWALYFSFLILCLFTLYICGSNQKLQRKFSLIEV